jgi:hypothetical protein
MYVRFEQVFAPELTYFCNTLLNGPFQPTINSTYQWRFLRFDGKHPELLTSANYSAIVSSGSCFTRKIIQGQDTGLLDMLDKYIANIQ